MSISGTKTWTTHSGAEEYAKGTSRHFTRKKGPVANSQVKRYPLFSGVSEMQIRSTAHMLSIGEHKKARAIPSVGPGADLKEVSLTCGYWECDLGQPRWQLTDIISSSGTFANFMTEQFHSMVYSKKWLLHNNNNNKNNNTINGMLKDDQTVLFTIAKAWRHLESGWTNIK